MLGEYQNVSRPKRMLVYNLPLNIEPGTRVVVKQQARDPTTGDVRFMRSTKVIARSIKVPWGHTIVLTDGHLSVPEIRKDVDAGELKKLKALKAQVQSTAPTPPDEPSPKSETTKRSRSSFGGKKRGRSK